MTFWADKYTDEELIFMVNCLLETIKKMNSHNYKKIEYRKIQPV